MHLDFLFPKRSLTARCGLWIAAAFCIHATAQTAPPANTLPGHYYLSGVMEVGSELLLRPDGTFEWAIAYGAVDQMAKGHWSTDGETVTLKPDTRPVSSVQFRKQDAAPWNERVSHFYEHREQTEAEARVRRDCPLTEMSDNDPTMPDDPVVANFVTNAGEHISAEQVQKAREKALQSAQSAQQKIDRLFAEPGWQTKTAQIQEAAEEFTNYRYNYGVLLGLYQESQQKPGPPIQVNLPPACHLGDFVKAAKEFRGVAVLVYDPQHDQRGDGIQVKAHYNQGADVEDIVQQGYAFFPLPQGRQITAITLHVPGAINDNDTIFRVSYNAPTLQPIDADLEALVPQAFDHMTLRIHEDGSLKPVGDLAQGRYEKAPASSK